MSFIDEATHVTFIGPSVSRQPLPRSTIPRSSSLNPTPTIPRSSLNPTPTIPHSPPLSRQSTRTNTRQSTIPRSSSSSQQRMETRGMYWNTTSSTRGEPSGVSQQNKQRTNTLTKISQNKKLLQQIHDAIHVNTFQSIKGIEQANAIKTRLKKQINHLERFLR
mgnify:CR=1 FL=1